MEARKRLAGRCRSVRVDLAQLLKDWEAREEELALEHYDQHAGHGADEARMGMLAGDIERLAREALAQVERGHLPERLWMGLVENSRAGDLTRFSNEIYRARNQLVVAQVAGERVNLNEVRRFNQRHLREGDVRRQAFDSLMAKAAALTPTLEARFSLAADVWAPHDMTPLDVYLAEERVGLDRLKRAVEESALAAKPHFSREAESFSQEILGKPFEAHDDMYVFRHSIYNVVDEALADLDFERAMLDLARTLGFDTTAISIDGEVREGKYASPICFGVRIPGDVRVLYQRTTPIGDYESFYHEMGHALHFASVDPARRFDERRLIPNGIAEIFSTLFEDVAMDPAYLEEDLGIDGEVVAEILRRRRFLELYFLTFYGANGLFKIRFWEERLWEDFAAADALYADLTERFMGVRYPGIYWQTHHVLSTSDMYAPSYLLAHIRKSELRRVLTRKFGRAWWREPEAGAWLRAEAMGPGGSIDLDAFSTLDADAYVRPIVEARAA